MFSILITDDEKVLRAGIRKILSEAFPEIQLLEARNGQEALDLLHTNAIDILLTDIRMPVMNGIELMKTLSTQADCPHILVLSGYDEFSYAREAIACRAKTYILKPIDRNELVAEVQKVLDFLKKERKLSSEQQLTRLLTDNRADLACDEISLHIAGPYRCILLTGAAPEFALKLLKENEFWCKIEAKNDALALLISDTYTHTMVELFIKTELHISFSQVFVSLSRIRSCYRQAYIASFQRFTNTGSVHGYEEPSVQPDFNTIHSDINKLIRICGSAEQTELITCIETLFEMAGLSAHALCYLYESILNDFVHFFDDYCTSDVYLQMKRIMLQEAGTFNSISEWKKTVFDFVLYLNSLIRKDYVAYSFISQALSYIHANYTQNINMACVANQVSVNYTYFSQKFREHTGLNFNDYLKRLRLDTAKKLLSDGYYKVYEVARRSGFGDVKYFTRIFRDDTGLTPNEYRKKYTRH